MLGQGGFRGGFYDKVQTNAITVLERKIKTSVSVIANEKSQSFWVEMDGDFFSKS